MIVINGGNRATDRDLNHITFRRLEDLSVVHRLSEIRVLAVVSLNAWVDTGSFQQTSSQLAERAAAAVADL